MDLGFGTGSLACGSLLLLSKPWLSCSVELLCLSVFTAGLQEEWQCLDCCLVVGGPLKPSAAPPPPRLLESGEGRGRDPCWLWPWVQAEHPSVPNPSWHNLNSSMLPCGLESHWQRGRHTDPQSPSRCTEHPFKSSLWAEHMKVLGQTRFQDVFVLISEQSPE